MKKITILSVVALSHCFLQAQNIYTTAGNGTNGYSGDGGLAASAEISYPNGIGIDASGNVYIADANNRIRKVTAATGFITTFAGKGIAGYSGDGGQATAAEVWQPQGVGSDASGNLYIADTYNNRIRKVTAITGIITTVAGNGFQGYSGDGGQATAAELYYPQRLCLDTLGNIYFSDYNNSCIRKVTAATGIITTIAGNGSYGYSGDGGQATAAEFEYPDGVALDTQGNVYIADEYNHVIRKVTVATGIINKIAGNGVQGYSGDGGQATAAEFDYPDGVGLDASGNIYVADYFNHRIRKVNAVTGIIATIAGNGTASYCCDGSPATAAEINYPTDVGLDASGNVFISDYHNFRIREVTSGSPLGINESAISLQNVAVYPNPNNGKFTISLNNVAEKSSVEIYNMLGEKIYLSKLNATITQVNLTNNAAGIYLYRVLTETGNLVSEGKFVIQK